MVEGRTRRLSLIRLAIVVEGPTERSFVGQVLAAHLRPLRIVVGWFPAACLALEWPNSDSGATHHSRHQRLGHSERRQRTALIQFDHGGRNA